MVDGDKNVKYAGRRVLQNVMKPDYIQKKIKGTNARKRKKWSSDENLENN